MTISRAVTPGRQTQSMQTRRRVLGGIGAGLASVAVGLPPVRGFAQACKVTPTQMTGPFYPLVTPDEDWDLTNVAAGSGRADGTVVEIVGRVLDEQCRPVPHAVLEVWQANAAGRYDHPRDPNPAPRDPNFQGYGRLATDEDGRYRFLTVKPGPYPVDFGPVENWTRPPHIHFKVHQTFAPTLTTQMYFAGESLNDTDLLLQSVPEGLREMLVVDVGDLRADGVGRGTFNIAMSGTAPPGPPPRG